MQSATVYGLSKTVCGLGCAKRQKECVCVCVCVPSLIACMCVHVREHACDMTRGQAYVQR